MIAFQKRAPGVWEAEQHDASLEGVAVGLFYWVVAEVWVDSQPVSEEGEVYQRVVLPW